ncbi:DNA repair and meiosis protein MRE11 [Cryptosporidium ubiquitum]|uniref:Double-strand break repair protein n=1 Tax=Cryptosporidium ubiquitum TaxID=857276 RepID=A0A1J4MK21_9CRYT|nr:DNA repair and meiosis protein MRE11 [Cryptosporidium ubiquitum]OII74585.1 DNA repair and meiosis protein MRE11 [Cryptosporidium ubiquitum]
MEIAGVDDSTFKILVFTDTHAGYKERDGIRSNDSLVTLEEILIVGKKLNVDLILHSGDLFDVAKPSKYIMYKVMNIIRRYCMGNKKIKFRALNRRDLSNINGYNWEIGDANVSIPFFGIHGNHDDPGEEGLLSPLDILESARFINYIGKNSNVDNIEVSPVLLEKGSTRLAIYGIGNIRDERLYRSFERNKVKFLIPDNNDSEWFSILLFHQNRRKGNFGGTLSKDSIPESFLPDFLDLIIWGHEHECIVDPVEVANKNFFVLQPGSSIATSLIASESLQKHVVLLEVKNNTFKTTPIPLISPRIFLYDHVVLDKNITQVEEHLVARINELIEMAKVEHMEKNKLNLPQIPEVQEVIKNNSMELPILRLRVEYECDSQLINSKRFGFQFVGKTANPHEILMFTRRNRNNVKDLEQEDSIGLNSRMGSISFSTDDSNMIESLTIYYTEKLNGLEIISINDFNRAIDMFVNKFDSHSIENCIINAISKSNSFYKNNKGLEINEILQKVKENNKFCKNELSSNKIDSLMSEEFSDLFSEGEISDSSDCIKQSKRSRENKNTTNRRKSVKKGSIDGISDGEWN